MRLTRVLSAMLPMLAIAWPLACGRGGSTNKAGEREAATNAATVPPPPESGATAKGPAPPSLRYNGHIFVGGVAPAGDTMHNPFTGDAKAAQAGGAFFTSMNCDGCHGGGATGWVGPSLSDGRWRYGGADGEVFQSIYYGRPRGMPAFGGVLPAEYIWRIVTYLRTLPPPKDVPTESWQ